MISPSSTPPPFLLSLLSLSLAYFSSLFLSLGSLLSFSRLFLFSLSLAYFSSFFFSLLFFLFFLTPSLLSSHLPRIFPFHSSSVPTFPSPPSPSLLSPPPSSLPSPPPSSFFLPFPSFSSPFFPNSLSGLIADVHRIESAFLGLWSLQIFFCDYGSIQPGMGVLGGGQVSRVGEMCRDLKGGKLAHAFAHGHKHTHSRSHMHSHTHTY